MEEMLFDEQQQYSSEEVEDTSLPNLLSTVEEGSLPTPFDPLRKYLSDVAKYPVLSREDEHEIALRIHENKDVEAVQRLVMSNLKLVVKIALEYYSTYINILDLIQEGNVGLLHAVKKFNPYKGTKFSTYASFWIRAYILKHIMDSWSLVKIGTTQSQRKLFYRLSKEKQKLEALGIIPAPQLLASTLDVSEEEVVDMERRLAHSDISLETPLHDDGDDTMLDVIGSGENVEEIVADKEKDEMIVSRVREFKETLNDKERYVFEHRIMSEEPVTLQEIGAHFDISRERARQIESKVIKKFKERFRTEFHNFDFS